MAKSRLSVAAQRTATRIQTAPLQMVRQTSSCAIDAASQANRSSGRQVELQDGVITLPVRAETTYISSRDTCIRSHVIAQSHGIANVLHRASAVQDLHGILMDCLVYDDASVWIAQPPVTSGE